MGLTPPQRDVVSSIISLCDAGYRTGNVSYYEDIKKKAEDLPSSSATDKIIRMADAGPTLSSSRFAYPHIQDRARDLLGTAHE